MSDFEKLGEETVPSEYNYRIGVKGRIFDIHKIVTLDTGLWLLGHPCSDGAYAQLKRMVYAIYKALSPIYSHDDELAFDTYFRIKNTEICGRYDTFCLILMKCSLYSLKSNSHPICMARSGKAAVIVSMLEDALKSAREHIREEELARADAILKKVGL
jgi:hypothetical protein